MVRDDVAAGRRGGVSRHGWRCEKTGRARQLCSALFIVVSSLQYGEESLFASAFSAPYWLNLKAHRRVEKAGVGGVAIVASGLFGVEKICSSMKSKYVQPRYYQQFVYYQRDSVWSSYLVHSEYGTIPVIHKLRLVVGLHRQH